MVGHGGIKTFGHERASGAFEFLKRVAGDLAVSSIEKTEGKMAGIF